MINHYLLIAINAMLIDNFIVVKFLGLCPCIGISTNINTAMGMGLATTCVITIASIVVWTINTIVIIPLNIIYLRNLIYILTIAIIVQFMEIIIHKTSPTLYRLLGIFLPLITTNCAVLGVMLLNINLQYNLQQSILYGLFTALGFSVVIILFAAIRERLMLIDIPKPFRGNAIALITIGIISMAFIGFSGIGKNII